jgi:hypothetical protein
MPSIKDAFPSKYLKAADFAGRGDVKATINFIEMEEMQDGKPKPALYIKEQDRAIVLNKTNATVLAEAFGDDTDKWGGKSVVIHTMPTSFQGKTVQGIRIRPAPVDAQEPLNDDVPW